MAGRSRTSARTSTTDASDMKSGAFTLPREHIRHEPPGSGTRRHQPRGRPPTASAVTTKELVVPSVGDLRAMQMLAAAFPRSATHAVDLPYRLSSAASVPQRPDCQVETILWHEGSELVAWAVWTPGSQETDMAVHAMHAATLEPEILAWSGERARALARGRSDPLLWWVSVRDDNESRIALLEANGFDRRTFVTRRYERVLAELSSVSRESVLPDGLEVRPLRGESEVPAYVEAHRAAFNSTAMTIERRQSTLRVPGYRPELDLVVAARDGRVASFAILWLGPERGGRCEGQFEPVGTHPDFQRRGLGRALLLEGMRRLRAAGATHAIAETENVRVAANALYRSVMRRTGRRKLHYSKVI